ncbi:MAG: amidohydrolase family protein [Nocardiopsaceae bacterium]|nr:amidohydrolase family protein [Nocardiopsaceae bacterium]
MAVSRLLISGGSVLVGSPLRGVVEQVDVLVEDGVILRIGPGLDTVDAERIDASGCFVLPGFVDSHQHLWQTTMRGLTADWDLSEYFWCIRNNHSAAHTPADIFAGTYAGALAALDSGTTTTIDFSHCLNSPDHSDEAVRSIKESGIRAVWCYGLFAVPTDRPAFATLEQRWADARRIRDTQFTGSAKDELVTMGLALTEVGLQPWEATRAEFALARELGVMLTTHANVIWRPDPIPEIEWYHRDGLLGPNQLHSHANTSTDRELALLAEAGASTCSTPDTELQMGMGFPVFARAAALGVTVGLGGDIQSNNGQDPFTQMRLALQAENVRAALPTLEGEGLPGLNGSPATPREVLHYATLGSAQALGLGDVTGSLEPGKAADILLVRGDGLRQRPVVDPISTIVMHCGIGEVDTVLVAGKVVKRDGRLVHRDPAAAAGLVDQAYERLTAAIEQRGGWKPPMPEGFMETVMQAMAANAPDFALPDRASS